MKPTLIYRPGKRLSEAAADKRAPRTGKAPVTPAVPRKVTVAFKGADTPITLYGTDQYGKPMSETLVVTKKTAKAIKAIKAIKAVKAVKAVFAKKTPAKAKRKPRGTFDRDAYQQLYMLDRRAADRAGFGKGKNYKTVSEYRKWKAKQK